MSNQTIQQDDYFKIDPEFHLVGDMQPYHHFPGVQMWWKAIANIARPLLSGMPEELIAQVAPQDLAQLQTLAPTTDPDALLEIMDRYGVDAGCLLPESMMDTTGGSSRWVSNGEMAEAVERHPDRFLYQPNLSPIKQRGVGNAIWELEYWVKEKGARIFKFYPPEDTYINDPELWPFYAKAEAL
ncbi:MAG TPA: hypothetical protein VMU39_10440, partial [Solirubrobacteraceae bacterium]|nr:hypothetical protein [Solirubrobacteraceae bacterium]